ncbi:DUF1453 domain-containing protein [Luteibacter jiangsuensis]|uniref:DUF1453 domain-containing protein n=1 Tax=Luteibacter jiangsuensis TaxID=637577 RepID=A0ABX0Q8S4_9GAMM|nr:DUF1453 domain-containing protein [Luteibacter jiangsuensis]NID06246.1 DUF1453 domain-containing protein [Luteibacter jiangsuensis]
MLAPSALSFVFAAPLIAFAVYRRVRGSFGRQPIRTRRMTARVAIFAVLIGLMMLSGLQDIRLAEGALGGVLAGGALAALLGLRLTRFELGGDGADCYVPNAWMGGALTALLVGRLAWRFLMLAPAMAGGAVAQGPGPGNSPLTMAIVGLTVGYYLVYYAGILLHHRRYKRSLQVA